VTAEQAIAQALGPNFDSDKIVGWSVNENNYLTLSYEGDPGVSQTNIMVAVVDVTAE
jgi:hypothetical protein